MHPGRRHTLPEFAAWVQRDLCGCAVYVLYVCSCPVHIVVGRRSLSVWYGGGAAAQKRANLTPFNALHILAARTAVVPVTYTQPTHMCHCMAALHGEHDEWLWYGIALDTFASRSERRRNLDSGLRKRDIKVCGVKNGGSMHLKVFPIKLYFWDKNRTSMLKL